MIGGLILFLPDNVTKTAVNYYHGILRDGIIILLKFIYVAHL